ncbi:MAG: hypothetical protein JXQ30_16085 [Spirochaetes bacterium]|nr:hypothetical protein [Spirochaetota bacterium]
MVFRYKTSIVYLLLFVTAAVFSCRSTGTITEKLRSYPYKRLEHYPFDPASSLVSRVKEVPDIILSYYREMDETPSYAPYTPSQVEMSEIARCLSTLPAVHAMVLKERLIGIYFIENFHGSGMADYVLGTNGDMYLFLVFNPLTLKSTLAEYVSYKENSCFIMDDPDTEITIELSDRYTGFLYILLHEATHCIDYIERYTPFVEPHLAGLQDKGSRDTSFSDTVWAGYDELREIVVFTFRDRITFYGLGGGPKLKISEAMFVYEHLAHTPFVSLYGTFNWAEDFAEYVTYYYLVYGLGIEYRITVLKNGRIVYRYEPLIRSDVRNRIGQIDTELAGSLR